MPIQPSTRTPGPEFKERLLDSLQESVESGAFTRLQAPSSRALVGRSPASVLVAVVSLLVIAVSATAAVRSLVGDGEKRVIANKIDTGQPIGPLVASSGLWRLYAQSSEHPGLIAWEVT